jgi:hypothetical protein
MALTIKPNNTAPPKKTTETKGTVYRIITVFPKTIELDELSLPAEKTTRAQKTEDSVALEFPLIKINDYIFNRDEIVSFEIDCTEFLPSITLSTISLDQVFLSKEMPKDGDIISIAIRNRSDVLKVIRNDYVITGVHVQRNLTEQKTPVQMTFYGELFIPGLKSQKTVFSYNGTTLEAAMNFARIFGLGFATNEDNTDDKQIWLNANMAGDLFINSLTDRAWKDNQSFYQCWIDLYYNLNFINVNKQLLSAESESDLSPLISNLDKNWNFGATTDQEKTAVTIKVFSNYINFRTSSFYISSWRPFNRSSSITFEIGTKMSCLMFEHNVNLYNNPNSQKYWTIPIEPTYDKDKTNKTILLRGRAAYVTDPKNKDLKRANYSYPNIYEKYPWMGIQYTISNPNDDNLQWDGNHHKNYQVAKVQNLINNKEIDKLNLHVEVNGNNFNVIRGDKMPVILIKTDAVENMRINPDSNFNDMLDLFYSGWYFVKGFSLSWENTTSIMSGFTQEFILTRREWPAPVPVEPIKITTNN